MQGCQESRQLRHDKTCHVLAIGWVTLSGKGVSRRYRRRQGLCLRLHPVNVIITSVLSGATAA
jgi:hypothetical protein